MNEAALKIGVCAVVRRGTTVLLWRGDLQIHDSELMGFPGGKLEVGETLEQCCRRELHEETGLVATTTRYISSIAHNWGQKKWLTVYFEVDVSPSAQPRNMEPQKHGSFKFWDVADVNFEQRKLYMGTKAVLQELELMKR